LTDPRRRETRKEAITMTKSERTSRHDEVDDE
jgi:hypothetical protein